MSNIDIDFPDFFSNVKYGTTTLDNIKDLIPLLEINIDNKGTRSQREAFPPQGSTRSSPRPQ